MVPSCRVSVKNIRSCSRTRSPKWSSAGTARKRRSRQVGSIRRKWVPVWAGQSNMAEWIWCRHGWMMWLFCFSFKPWYTFFFFPITMFHDFPTQQGSTSRMWLPFARNVPPCARNLQEMHWIFRKSCFWCFPTWTKTPDVCFQWGKEGQVLRQDGPVLRGLQGSEQPQAERDWGWNSHSAKPGRYLATFSLIVQFLQKGDVMGIIWFSYQWLVGGAFWPPTWATWWISTLGVLGTWRWKAWRSSCWGFVISRGSSLHIKQLHIISKVILHVKFNLDIIKEYKRISS